MTPMSGALPIKSALPLTALLENTSISSSNSTDIFGEMLNAGQMGILTPTTPQLAPVSGRTVAQPQVLASSGGSPRQHVFWAQSNAAADAKAGTSGAERAAIHTDADAVSKDDIQENYTDGVASIERDLLSVSRNDSQAPNPEKSQNGVQVVCVDRACSESEVPSQVQPVILRPVASNSAYANTDGAHKNSQTAAAEQPSPVSTIKCVQASGVTITGGNSDLAGKKNQTGMQSNTSESAPKIIARRSAILPESNVRSAEKPCVRDASVPSANQQAPQILEEKDTDMPAQNNETVLPSDQSIPDSDLTADGDSNSQIKFLPGSSAEKIQYSESKANTENIRSISAGLPVAHAARPNQMNPVQTKAHYSPIQMAAKPPETGANFDSLSEDHNEQMPAGSAVEPTTPQSPTHESFSAVQRYFNLESSQETDARDDSKLQTKSDPETHVPDSKSEFHFPQTPHNQTGPALQSMPPRDLSKDTRLPVQVSTAVETQSIEFPQHNSSFNSYPSSRVGVREATSNSDAGTNESKIPQMRATVPMVTAPGIQINSAPAAKTDPDSAASANIPNDTEYFFSTTKESSSRATSKVPDKIDQKYSRSQDAELIPAAFSATKADPTPAFATNSNTARRSIGKTIEKSSKASAAEGTPAPVPVTQGIEQLLSFAVRETSIPSTEVPSTRSERAPQNTTTAVNTQFTASNPIEDLGLKASSTNEQVSQSPLKESHEEKVSNIKDVVEIESVRHESIPGKLNMAPQESASKPFEQLFADFSARTQFTNHQVESNVMHKSIEGVESVKIGATETPVRSEITSGVPVVSAYEEISNQSPADGRKIETKTISASAAVLNAVLEAASKPLSAKSIEIRTDGFGTIRIRLTRDADAGLKVEIHASDPAAHALLSNNVTELKQALRADSVVVPIRQPLPQTLQESTDRRGSNLQQNSSRQGGGYREPGSERSKVPNSEEVFELGSE